MGRRRGGKLYRARLHKALLKQHQARIDKDVLQRISDHSAVPKPAAPFVENILPWRLRRNTLPPQTYHRPDHLHPLDPRGRQTNRSAKNYLRVGNYVSNHTRNDTLLECLQSPILPRCDKWRPNHEMIGKISTVNIGSDEGSDHPITEHVRKRAYHLTRITS